MAGLYIHVPFCLSKCSYCDFYSCTSTDRIDSFVGALLREMQARSDYLGRMAVETIYLGGGTPSLLPVRQIDRILNEAARHFDLLTEEITLEANPDDLSPKYLAELASTPVNRLSIGIQSFDDTALRLMNRRHTATQAEKAICDAQQAGFDNISADLIFGIPGMNDTTWERSIEQLAALDIQHISAYHLTIEDGTRFGKMILSGEFLPVDELTSERQYAILREKLGAAGFDHYEISNFALPGRRSRHNSSYWVDKPYLGLGPSAHSYNGIERCVCTADAISYIEQCPTPDMFETESLSGQDIHNEYIMVRLRCKEGIDLREFENKFGGKSVEILLDKAEKFMEDGLLEKQNGHLCVPCEKFLVSDRIISELFDI